MYSIELSLEQQFSIRSFETRVSQMFCEQAQSFLFKLYHQMIVQAAIFKQLLKHEWELDGKSLNQ